MLHLGLFARRCFLSFVSPVRESVRPDSGFQAEKGEAKRLQSLIKKCADVDSR